MSRPMTRLAGRAMLALALLVAGLPLAAQTFDGTLSGHWWNPARAREGQFITFESVGDRRVATLAYFTYGAGGAATWYVGNADYAAGAASITFPLVTGAGGRFGPLYRPEDVAITPAGTATLTYVSCNAMRLAIEGPASFAIDLTRVAGPLTGAPCGGAPANTLASGPTPFPAGCGDGPGTNYPGAEVEPHLAVNPLDANHVIATWQQDRWSNGSARGVVTAASFDGGRTWTRRAMAFSRCGGGPYERATDPWVAFGPSGMAWSMGLGSTGASFAAGSANAMLVSRSTDGGRTWGNPVTLAADGAAFFNDKNTLTADPEDARFAYAVWDRLNPVGTAPTMFTRTTDGGATWEPARAIADPGAGDQTLGNVIVALPGGTLVNFYAHLERGPANSTTNTLRAVRSTDRGVTWSAPIRVASLLTAGTRDPRNGARIRDGTLIPQAAAGPGGVLHVVWQDSRFSGGERDEVAYSRSTDGGFTWREPVRVNPPLGTQAFTASVAASADGTVGVSYYDLRDDTVEGEPLATGRFLAQSADGVTWRETRLDGPFDQSSAPQANGLFLGDYTGLAAAGRAFVAVYARTTGDASNPTDIRFASVTGEIPAKSAGGGWEAQPAAPFTIDAAWQARMDEAARAVLARRRVPR